MASGKREMAVMFDGSSKQLGTIGEYGFRFFRKTHDLGNFNNVRHWHDWLEFELILEGEEVKEVNGKQYHLKKGEGIFVNAGRMHSQAKVGKAFSLFTITCDPTLLSGQEKGLFYRKYMQRLLRSDKFDCIVLD